MRRFVGKVRSSATIGLVPRPAEAEVQPRRQQPLAAGLLGVVGGRRRTGTAAVGGEFLTALGGYVLAAEQTHAGTKPCSGEPSALLSTELLDSTHGRGMGEVRSPSVLESPCMLPFKLIYSDHYDLHLGDHVFPSSKYRLIREKLLESQLASDDDFLEPPPAEDADLLLVHTADWVRKLKTGALEPSEIYRMEVPYSPEMVRAVWLSAGGSILAGRRALADRVAVNIGGGFHHAFPDHGEGFCVIHDVAVGIRKLQTVGAIARAMTVDLDVHHGNGTAFVFARDPSVFTFSMHQERNYPLEKPPSDLDIHLHDGCEDEQYLRLLRENLHHALSVFHPDLIFYLAGADPYREDQLGGLALTKAGLAERDRIVFAMARERDFPVAVTFAGGYARRLEDTIAIHVGTVRAAYEAMSLLPVPDKKAG